MYSPTSSALGAALDPGSQRQAEEDGSYPQPEVVGQRRQLLEAELQALLPCGGGEPQLHVVEVVEVEDAPAHYHYEQGIEAQQHAGDVLLPLDERHLLYGEDEAEVEAPDDEVPRCAVPHSGQEPDGEDVEGLVAAVAAQGDVGVVAEEGAQRHMPAAPEVGDGGAAVGVREVLGEVEAHAAAQADGHVRVAGEVEVDLQGEGDDAYPGAPHGELADAVGQEHGRDLGEHVGQDHLLAQAEQEAVYSVGHVGGRDVSVVEFVCHRAVAHDGTGDELREHGDVQQQVHEAALRRALAPVDVHQVGDGLEYVEADADGERQPGHVDVQAEGAEYLAEEAQVLEGAEQAEVERQAHCQRELAVAFGGGDAQAREVVDDNAEEHEQDVDRLAPGVEEEREDYQREVSGREAGPVASPCVGLRGALLLDAVVFVVGHVAELVGPEQQLLIYPARQQVQDGECRDEDEQEEEIGKYHPYAVSSVDY